MQPAPFTRRQFLATSAAAAALTALPRAAAPSESSLAQPFKHQIKRAFIVNTVTEETLTPLKQAGFDGAESRDNCPPEQAAKARKLAESMGMRIHSVMRGRVDLDTEDPKLRDDSIEKVRQGLRAVAGYGADDLLLVPCRIPNLTVPKPWEYDLEFDPQTLHVKRVVKGDNSRYEPYIKAQNHATDHARLNIEKCIPLADELKVVIAIENVWNNLWVTPDFYKAFVSSFHHPRVMSYFDIGNHVKYVTPPQVWIKTLGPLIEKVHVKDYKLAPDNHGGDWAPLREGSINWPAVRQALDDAGYDRWATIEAKGLPLPEFRRRLDLILAGK